ncbi:MAG TPA: CAP domain-containing protein [Propionicimonas sp.]|nr:CAP domain-containing protein [Propionicimonas sp.]HRA07329.1 CAP domain-containing protein [Propionicimonas sp.]
MHPHPSRALPTRLLTVLVGALIAFPIAQSPAHAETAAGPSAVIEAISPTTGFAIEYETVTVSGANFTDVTAVSFGDYPAKFKLASAGALVANVPDLPLGTYPIVLNTPAGAVASASGYTVASLEAEVLRLVNTARATKRKCGGTTYKKAKPLTWSAPLAQAASAHSADMASANYFSHYSTDGTSPFTRIKATGYRYSSAGENIAAGYDTPSAVVKAWLKSPGHCKNIMKKGYTQLGIGYAEGGKYGTYWTQDFGKPKK